MYQLDSLIKYAVDGVDLSGTRKPNWESISTSLINRLEKIVFSNGSVTGVSDSSTSTVSRRRSSSSSASTAITDTADSEESPCKIPKLSIADKANVKILYDRLDRNKMWKLSTGIIVEDKMREVETRLFSSLSLYMQNNLHILSMDSMLAQYEAMQRNAHMQSMMPQQLDSQAPPQQRDSQASSMEGQFAQLDNETADDTHERTKHVESAHEFADDLNKDAEHVHVDVEGEDGNSDVDVEWEDGNSDIDVDRQNDISDEDSPENNNLKLKTEEETMNLFKTLLKVSVDTFGIDNSRRLVIKACKDIGMDLLSKKSRDAKSSLQSFNIEDVKFKVARFNAASSNQIVRLKPRDTQQNILDNCGIVNNQIISLDANKDLTNVYAFGLFYSMRQNILSAKQLSGYKKEFLPGLRKKLCEKTKNNKMSDAVFNKQLSKYERVEQLVVAIGNEAAAFLLGMYITVYSLENNLQEDWTLLMQELKAHADYLQFAETVGLATVVNFSK